VPKTAMKIDPYSRLNRPVSNKVASPPRLQSAALPHNADFSKSNRSPSRLFNDRHGVINKTYSVTHLAVTEASRR
jgi:hypothetical protein